MKRHEKDFLDKFSESKSEKLDFKSIFKKTNSTFKEENKVPFYKNKKVIVSMALSLVLLISIVGVSTYFLIPRLETIKFNNQNEFITEYELNSNLVLDNIQVKKIYNNKEEVVGLKELDFDTSAFKSEPGVYDIGVSLRNDDNKRLEYEVQVIDDYLESIEVDESSTRKLYYEGEIIKQNDLKVIKHRKNKNGYANVYDVDIKNATYLKEGKNQPINVSLKSNNAMTATYYIDVFPLSDLNINSKFYMIDDSYSSYQPTILGFEIKDNVAIPYYSDLIVEGNLFIEAKDGNIVLKCEKYNQSATYNPYLGTLTFEGLTVSDKPMYLFELKEKDKILTIADEALSSYQFVALNGKVDKNTLKYFDDVFGGVYLDKECSTRVNRYTTFTKDTTLYLNTESDPSIEQKFIGKYTSDDKIISYDITENEIRSYTNKNANSYYVKKDKYDRPIIEIRGDESNPLKLTYDEKIDSLILVEDDKVYETFHRYNPEGKVLIKLEDNFVTYEMIHEQGYRYDKEQSTEVLEEKVLYISPSINNGEPIYEDKTFTNLNISYNDLFDLSGKYGTYKNYLEIGTNWRFDLPSIKNRMAHSYALINDMQLVEKGYITFDSIILKSKDEKIFKLKLTNQNNQVSYIEIRWNIKLPELNEKEALIGEQILTYKNENFLEDLPIIGKYLTLDGEEIEITSSGYITKTTNTGVNVSSTEFTPIYITKVNENEIDAYYIIQNIKDEKENIDIKFIKNSNSKFEIDYKGKHYIQN